MFWLSTFSVGSCDECEPQGVSRGLMTDAKPAASPLRLTGPNANGGDPIDYRCGMSWSMLAIAPRRSVFLRASIGQLHGVFL